VLPEVEKLEGLKIFCFYGSDEENTLCRNMTPDRASIIERPGGHRIGRDVEFIAETILKNME
jgi:type IV secretory pathway VirJ component